MTVAACIIAQGPSKDLTRCLRSLKDRVDQVCAIHTGKGELGWPKQAWTDDFAAARNAAVALAATDFWFYIDSDEALEGDIRALCDQMPADMDGCLIAVNNLVEDDGEVGTIGSTASQFRLVRNHIGAKFEGRIHEQIVLPDGRDPMLASVKGVSITHWGYLPDRMKGKHIRNLTLLRKAIQDEPEKIYNHFQLGVQHISVEDYHAAFEALWTAVKLWGAQGQPALPFVPTMFTSTILAALRSKQYELAVSVAAAAPSSAFTPEYFYYTAMATFELGLINDAHDLLVRGREANADPAFHDPNTLGRIEIMLESL